MTLSDADSPQGPRHWFRQRLATGAMNILWLLVTIGMLVPIHYLWPYHDWGWGLIPGACVGGMAVFLTVFAAFWVRDRRHP